jgi:hypothetical protein
MTGLRERKKVGIGFTISIRLLRWRFSKFFCFLSRERKAEDFVYWLCVRSDWSPFIIHRALPPIALVLENPRHCRILTSVVVICITNPSIVSPKKSKEFWFSFTAAFGFGVFYFSFLLGRLLSGEERRRIEVCHVSCLEIELLARYVFSIVLCLGVFACQTNPIPVFSPELYRVSIPKTKRPAVFEPLGMAILFPKLL